MKRLIAVGLLVNATLLAGVFLKKEVFVHAAGGGGGTPKWNGDVNGDGQIDISDAVYLLSSLFLGGPAPKVIECLPPARNEFPATGQTKCYGFFEGGFTELCDLVECKGQDGQYATGCPFDGRFVHNGDGTVTDRCTALGLDVFDVLGSVEDLFEDDEILRRMDANAAAFQLPFGAAVEHTVLKWMPWYKDLGADSSAAKDGHMCLAPKLIKHCSQVRRTWIPFPVLASCCRELFNEAWRL